MTTFCGSYYTIEIIIMLFHELNFSAAIQLVVTSDSGNAADRSCQTPIAAACQSRYANSNASLGEQLENSIYDLKRMMQCNCFSACVVSILSLTS